MGSSFAELGLGRLDDVFELAIFGLGLEAEIDLGVVVGPHLRQLAAAACGETPPRPRLPAQRLQDADRALRVDDALGEGGDLLLVRTPGRSDRGRRERLFWFGDGERQPAIQRDGLLFRARVRTLRHISIQAENGASVDSINRERREPQDHPMGSRAAF